MIQNATWLHDSERNRPCDFVRINNIAPSLRTCNIGIPCPNAGTMGFVVDVTRHDPIGRI